MQITYYFRTSILVLACILPAFTPALASGLSTVPDSLLTEKYIRSIYISAPDSALHLLDEAEKRRLPSMPAFHIDILRSMVYESQAMYVLKERCLRRALQSDSVRLVPARRLRLLSQLSSTLDRLNRYEEGISISTEAISLAQELKQRSAESELLFTIGRIYQGMKNPDQALEYMLRSINLLKGSDNVRELALLSTFYGDLSSFYEDRKQNDDAISTSEARADVIRRMSEMPGPPAGYIDQQYGYLYSKLACFYQEAGQAQKAADAYARYRSTHFSQAFPGNAEITPYLLKSGQYKEALERNNTWQGVFTDGDSISYGYLVLLDRYAQIYRGLKQPALADAYQRRITVLTDSIYAREKQSRAHEFAVIYQTYEKDMQLQKERSTALLLRVSIAIACLVIVLLIIILRERQMNLRQTRQRNRIAARQIDELLAQREELRKMYAEVKVDKGGREEVDEEDREEVDEGEEGQEDVQEGEEEKDEESPISYIPSADVSEDSRRRFMQMEIELLETKAFLRQLKREDLQKLSGLKKNDVSRFIRENTGTSWNNYLNKLRVGYSVSLLKQKRLYSIEAIADMAGFQSRSVYYDAFEKIYKMTPAQYRETIDTEEEEQEEED